MLKAIVFDFDGVIADTEALHWRALLRVAQRWRFSFSYEEYLDRYVGFDDRDALRAIWEDASVPGRPDDSLIEQLVAEKAAAFEEVLQEGVQPVPGTLEFLQGVRGRLPLAIASGATRRDIDLVLERLDLLDCFDVFVSAEMVQRSKPDPQTYRLAVQLLAQRRPELMIQPQDCLAVEDTPAGIASARAAGLWTLALATTCPPQTLTAAHRVVPTLQGLTLEQLQGWFS